MCCTDPNGCRDAHLEAKIDGQPFAGGGLAFIDDSCAPFRPNDYQYSLSGPFEFQNGSILLKETGTYQITHKDGSHTLTVEEQPPNFSVSGCSIQPQTVTEGETVTVAATVSNTGGDGQATVTFSDGSGTVASVQRSVPGGSTATVSVDLVYDTPGEYGISVDAS